jgi:dynein assembly factor 5
VSVTPLPFAALRPLTSRDSRFGAVASALDYETQRKLYPELLKRLDDSNDAIRVEAARAFEQFLRGMAPGFEPGQMEYMVRALCVHLDDSNAGVQDAVQAVMLQVCTSQV